MSELTPIGLRASRDLLRTQAGKVSTWTQMRNFVDEIPSVLLAVNTAHQIVYANHAALDFFHAHDADEVIGKRTGDAANCMHSRETPEGCCGPEVCKVCGLYRAVHQALQGDCSVEECRMMLPHGLSLDLRVWARRFDLDGERFAFLSIQDTCDEKRRQVLEAVFLRDLFATAGGLQSITEVADHLSAAELREFHEIVAGLAGQIVDEIQAQRDLLAAERGELHVKSHRVNSRDVVAGVVADSLNSQACDGKTIQAAEICEEILFPTDSSLLRRVLENLARNALEATGPDGTVTIGCHLLKSDTVEFFVHNDSSIPHDLQLQIFNRSFSTKGTGRGLGTYSVRLLVERYLGGQVDFTSNQRLGTIFFVRLPRDFPAQPGISEHLLQAQIRDTGAWQTKFSQR